MIQVTNLKTYPEVTDFEDYLKIPGTSFSGLKQFDGTPSYGMKIGKLVHTYLLKPKEYNYEEYEIVKPLASKLVDYIGMDIIKMSTCEQPATADFEYEELLLKWKGLLDLRLENIVVVDFKIINGSLEYYCNRFNYPEQVRGYMLPFNVDLGLIMAVDRITKKVTVKSVQQNDAWWKNIILTRGQVIKKQTI